MTDDEYREGMRRAFDQPLPEGKLTPAERKALLDKMFNKTPKDEELTEDEFDIGGEG